MQTFSLVKYLEPQDQFIILSLLQCFGLIFKDTFSYLRCTATQGALVVNVNAALGKLIGPITGVLLKVYGCRRIALVPASLLTLGMVLTSFCRSFAFFVVAYGLISSMGMQMSESTQRLALNFYFKKKRSVAMGFAVTAAGFGPILVPQLIRVLMRVYSTQEVALIYGGICTHVFVAASLLQPVTWHMKEERNNPEEGLLLDEKSQECEKKRETLCGTILTNIAKIFDLDLLKDPVFDNILVGLALATFAEINFTLLMPFILHDFGLKTGEIATFLSILGVSDMLFRFVGPYIGNYFTKPSRLMYVYALAILTVVRFTLLISKNYYVLLVIAFAWGIAKGVRKVYMWLVIPDHVSADKLASAGGIETLANGICILVGGPIMGALRDATGSYVVCIVVMNCVTLVTILMWSAEAVIVKCRGRNKTKVKE
ncbi:monocarboxylate transporter 2-like [Zophobas morio]|uniref:monocarboxylate transporter 2-like n=1 Tax=Zophobas morio TaxID=2755281 RepID=UPI0030838154